MRNLFSHLMKTCSPLSSVVFCDSQAIPELVQEAEKQEKAARQRPFPGLYQQSLDEFTSVLTPNSIEGCQIEYHHQFNEYFGIAHTLLLGSSQFPQGFYYFQANVAPQTSFLQSTTSSNSAEPNTLLFCRLRTDKFVETKWYQKLSENWTVRLDSRLINIPGYSSADTEWEYKKKDYTGTIKTIGSQIIGCSYLQQLTREWSLGGELYYHLAKNEVNTSYRTKYAAKDYSVAFTLANLKDIQINYLRKVSEHVKLANQLLYSPQTNASTVGVGAEVVLDNDTKITTSVDQSLHIGTSIEVRVNPFMKLTLSGEGSPLKDEYKFGYGIQIYS